MEGHNAKKNLSSVHKIYNLRLTPLLLMPKIIRPGRSPIGSSIFRTLKKTEFP